MALYLSKIIDFLTPSILKKKNLEESIEDFKNRIDLIVSDLIYPYLHPSEETKTQISTSENERFLQLLSLLEPEQCQKISLILADNLDKKYNKVELEQFANSIYIEHPHKMLEQISKQTMCNSVAIHYTKILNLIAAILSAVNPEYNICINRLNNLMILTTNDATIGISRVCQTNKTIAKSILNEPGMKQLLILYYFALVQEISTQEEKENITKQYNYLVNSFSNLVYKYDGTMDENNLSDEVNDILNTSNQMKMKLNDLKLSNITHSNGDKKVNGRINKLETELTNIQNQIKSRATTTNNVSKTVLNKLNNMANKMEKIQSKFDDLQIRKDIESKVNENLQKDLENSTINEFSVTPEKTQLNKDIGFQPENDSDIESIPEDTSELVGDTDETSEMLSNNVIDNINISTNEELNKLENDYIDNNIAHITNLPKNNSFISPIEPVIPPIEPVIPPVQPTISPVQPVILPVQPTILPVQPVIPPDQLIQTGGNNVNKTPNNDKNDKNDNNDKNNKNDNKKNMNNILSNMNKLNTNTTQPSNAIDNNDIVKKFLEFASMFPKIGNIDPKVMPFIETTFRKQNNFDPSNGFQKDLFIPEDNFQQFCKTNMNGNGEIIINLNDNKFKQFINEYENLKKIYIQKSTDLLSLLENNILVKKQQKIESTEMDKKNDNTNNIKIGKFGLAKINYSDLTILETDIRNILVDLYTKAHTYYQSAVIHLYHALNDVSITPPKF